MHATLHTPGDAKNVETLSCIAFAHVALVALVTHEILQHCRTFTTTPYAVRCTYTHDVQAYTRTTCSHTPLTSKHAFLGLHSGHRGTATSSIFQSTAMLAPVP